MFGAIEKGKGKEKIFQLATVKSFDYSKLSWFSAFLIIGKHLRIKLNWNALKVVSEGLVHVCFFSY